MSLYSNDRAWSDLMTDQIRAIVGPFLLQPTSMEMDRREAADFFVFTARDMKIAARVRRPGYAERYPFDFTLRSQRDSGAETELSKICSGWGDWLFYGHTDDDDRIILWWLIDLSAFRRALIFHDRKGFGTFIKSIKKSNGDGTHFVAYDLRSFPDNPPILIASSRPLFAEAAE